jgi:hypothetical protein
MPRTLRKSTPPVLSGDGGTVQEQSVFIERRVDGQLTARRGEVQCDVHVRMCFPWSEPGRFLSLRNADGEEFVLVADPAGLNESSRHALEDALAEAGFVFTLSAVLDIEEEVELRQWHVRTEQGARTFQTKLDDWPRRLPDGGLLIRDVNGDLYRLDDPARLDRRSRSLLWAFID